MIIGMGQKVHPNYATLQDKVVTDAVARPSYGQRVKEAAWVHHMACYSFQWSRTDVFYNFRNDSGGEDYGLYNWKDANSYKLVKTGTVTYTSMDGHQGNGTTGRYSTQWSPNTGPNMLQDSASVCFDMITDGGGVHFGCNNNGDRFINLNGWTTRLNEAAASTGDAPSNPGVGRWIFTKNAINNAITQWKNGVDDTQPAMTSTGGVPSTFAFYIFCRNNNGTAANFSSTKFGFMCMGGHVIDPVKFDQGVANFKA